MQIAESKPIGFKNKLLLEHAVHIREQIGFSETDKNLLRNHNFDEIIAAQYCSSVDFECLHHYFHGIGIRNIHNGLEFFNDDEYKQPKTAGVPGLVVVVNTVCREDRSCLLFENLMDMLAFLTLQKHHLLSKRIKIPPKCDYIILNKVTNWQYLFSRIEEYCNICCFFSNTDYGEVLAKTVIDLHKGHSRDYSGFYSRCKTIADYLQLRKGRI